MKARELQQQDGDRRHRLHRLLQGLRSQRVSAGARGGSGRLRRRRHLPARDRLHHALVVSNGDGRRGRADQRAGNREPLLLRPGRSRRRCRRAAWSVTQPWWWPPGWPTTALCLRALNARSEFRYGQFDKERNQQGLDAPVPWFYAFLHPFGFFTPAHWSAFWARRHMHEYGTRYEHFGAIAVAARKHAARNPKAQVLPAADHDRRLHAVPDGGRPAASVRLLSRDRRCLRGDRHQRRARPRSAPSTLLHPRDGAGQRGQGSVPDRGLQSPADHGHGRAQRTANFRFEMADLRREDIDVAELYDHFGPLVLVSLEDLGFCKPGEGGPFVEGGRIELGGEPPINTHGGLVRRSLRARLQPHRRGACGRRAARRPHRWRAPNTCSSPAPTASRPAG